MFVLFYDQLQKIYINDYSIWYIIVSYCYPQTKSNLVQRNKVELKIFVFSKYYTNDIEGY